MFSVCIITDDSGKIEALFKGLIQRGYACAITSDGDEAISQVVEKSPDLVLLESNSYSRIKELSHAIKRETNLPIIVLIHQEMLSNVDGYLDLIDDFIFEPYDLRELELRIRRLLRRRSDAENDEIIRCGDLAIDAAKYEVFVGARPVLLTFKEYELLKFLANNRGRVFTREALLNKVWSYDYYGGDRTVDVHITRLRSKIKDSNHAFIDTVRNIGYRLRTENG